MLLPNDITIKLECSLILNNPNQSQLCSLSLNVIVNVIVNREQKLMEKIELLFESKEQMISLVTRIVANLVLKRRKGETFDGLVEKLIINKNTISTHLPHLQSAHCIAYYTKL